MKKAKKFFIVTIKIICYINFFILQVSLKKITFKAKNKIPKVSIFIPIYNKELFLNRSLNSILKQTITNIEIIAVNDCSTDNTLKVLKHFSSIDNRIKIVNNDRNHGLLYSRAMGILNCTGEYLINLDPDDKFSNENDLERLYQIAKSHKLDLIQYEIKRIWSFNNNNFGFSNDIEVNKTYNFTSKKNKAQALITNKFIKKEIIFKACKYFSKYIFNKKWNYHEDKIWHRLILKYSKLKINFNEVIYIYFKNNPYSLMHNLKNHLEHKNRLYSLDMINKIEKNKISDSMIWLLNNIKSTIKNDTETRKQLIRIIIRNINNHKYDKNELKKNKKILNKLSNGKIIFLFDSKSHYKIKIMKFFNLYKFIGLINGKILQKLNINNKMMINNYTNYIYNRDIFFANINICFSPKFKELISLFPNNKFFILTNNNNKRLLNLFKFHNIFLLNLNSNHSLLQFKSIINA